MSRWDPLIRRLLEEQLVDWHGIHGLSHWGRVYDNGVRLAEANGARLEVVELFAFFHDSQRFDDGHDPEHGPRGAELARRLRGELFDLDDRDFTLLRVACRDHTIGLTHPDITVRTCWDADRLDLGRIGVIPDRRRLCTEEARSEDMRAWALARSRSETIAEVIADIWHERWSDGG